MSSRTPLDLLLHNGQITTLDPERPKATSLAVKDGRIVGVDDAEACEHASHGVVAGRAIMRLEDASWDILIRLQ